MFAVRFLVVSGVLACGGALAQDTKPKTFSVSFQNVAWDDVLAWYAKETGLTFAVGTEKPKGALTLKPGVGKKFTIGELTDLLNESLALQGRIMVRGEKSFFVPSINEKIDISLVPFVSLADLKYRGSTELVRVLLKPTDLVLDNLGDVKKLLTAFGDLERVKDSVILTDTAGNVQRIVRVLEALGAP